MNVRVNYRQLLPITIGKGQKVYLQASIVLAEAPKGKFFNLPCGQKVEVVQLNRTHAEITG